MIKELAEKCIGKFNCLGESIKKDIIFSFRIKKEVQELIKMEKKLQKLYFTDYHLLATQDLCQDHFQISLIIILKEFINLNAQILISAVLNTET